MRASCGGYSHSEYSHGEYSQSEYSQSEYSHRLARQRGSNSTRPPHVHHHQAVVRLPLFQLLDLTPGLLPTLASAFEPTVFLPREALVSRGGLTDRILVLTRGVAHYQPKGGGPVAKGDLSHRSAATCSSSRVAPGTGRRASSTRRRSTAQVPLARSRPCGHPPPACSGLPSGPGGRALAARMPKSGYSMACAPGGWLPSGDLAASVGHAG